MSFSAIEGRFDRGGGEKVTGEEAEKDKEGDEA